MPVLFIFMEFYNALHLSLFFLLSVFGLREVYIPAPSHMETKANHSQLLICSVSPWTESAALKKYLNSLFLFVLQSLHPKTWELCWVCLLLYS